MFLVGADIDFNHVSNYRWEMCFHILPLSYSDVSVLV